MKKFISIICASVLSFCISCSYVNAQDKNDTYDTAVMVVNGLGLMTGDANGDLMLDKEVTRAEFVSIIYRLCSDDEPAAPTESKFSDIGTHHWASGYIHVMAENGAVSGFSDGTFRPSGKITTAEAYSMLLRVAGYADYMNSYGSYPENAMKTAAMTELSKGLGFVESRELKREDVVKILYNLLDIDVMAMSFKASDSSSYYQSGKFLEEVMDMYKEKGVIDGAGGISFEGRKIKDDYISIGGVEMYNDAGITYDDLGMYGVYYYKVENDEPHLKCFIPQKNNVLTISSDQQPSYVSNTYTYYDNGKRTTLKVSPQKDIIYNGITEHTARNMIPTYGEIFLIDNNGDGVYDVVKINDYEILYFEYLNESENTIYYLQNDKRKGINLDDYEKVVVLDETGKEIKVSALNEKSLIMVQRNGNEQIRITACTKNVKGEIAKVVPGDTNELSTIRFEGNETEYKIAAGCVSLVGTLSLDMQIVAYIDIYGNIALITKGDNTGSWQVGYMLKFKQNIDEDKATVKLFSSSGAAVEYDLADKVRLDGVTVEKAVVTIPYGTVFRYWLNEEGKIRKLDLPFNKDFYETTLKTDEKLKEDDKLMLRTDSRLAYTNRYLSWRQSSSSDDKNALLPGRPFLTSDTVIFRVPQATSYEGDITKYSVIKTSGVANNYISYIQSYNTEVESVDSEILVIIDSAARLDNSATAILVTKVNQVVNDDNEVTYALTGYYNGALETLTFRDSEKAIIDGRLIEKGDLVRVAALDGVINERELLYDNTGKLGTLATVGWSGDDVGFLKELRYARGYAEYIDDNGKMIFKPQFTGSTEEPVDLNKLRIYFVDRNDPSEVAREGSWREIVSKEQDSTNYDTLLVKHSWVGDEAFIIRN